ncbi:MAG: formylmethanofuran dehydrogenase subunit C [Candidatus Bathyarchaeota archaeon]|jgi:formylmethanofuran dehydrogenase subunit C
MTTLYPLKEFKMPVMAECIIPDIFQDLTNKEIKKLEVWEGNKRKKLGDLFKIKTVKETKSKSQNEKNTILINGDVSRVRRIGANMSHGVINIQGDVGNHLGEEMAGGRIMVKGNVGGWAGSMMIGGEIEIQGNTGDYLGSPYRGLAEGMRGGEITIHGNTGNEAGTYMQKGLIKIYGNAGEFTGLGLHKGTIYIKKDCEGRAGPRMTGGKIIVEGVLNSVLPSFSIETIKTKVKISKDEAVKGPFYTFQGDINENGTGKLHVSKENNPHLKRYEKFL